MASTPPPAAVLPLSALLSQALVAFVIEFDNEFEHQMPHRTTGYGSSPGGGLTRLPWLVSMAMWADCARWVPPARAGGPHTSEGKHGTLLGDAAVGLALPELLSKALHAYQADFGRHAELALAHTANVVRMVGDGGTPIRDLPGLTGIAPMSVDNSLSILARYGYLTVGPDPAVRRTKVARLTQKGVDAQDAYLPAADATEAAWASRSGTAQVRAVRRAVADVVVERSLLRAGLEPHPGGWRSKGPVYEALPHFPIVSHRGGFPDGN